MSTQGREDRRDIANYRSLSPKTSDSGQRSDDAPAGKVLRTVASVISGGRKSRRSAHEGASTEPPKSPSADADKYPKTSHRKLKTSAKEENSYLRTLERLSSPEGSDVSCDVGRSTSPAKRSVPVGNYSKYSRRSPSVEKVSRKFEYPERSAIPPVRKKDSITMVRSKQSISSLTAKFENNNTQGEATSEVPKPKTKLRRCESIGKSSLDTKRSRFATGVENDLKQERSDKVQTSAVNIPLMSSHVSGPSSLVSKFENQTESDHEVCSQSKFTPSPLQKVADKASIIAKFESPSPLLSEREKDPETTPPLPKPQPTSPQPTSPVLTTDIDAADFSPPYFLERPGDCSGVEQGSARLTCQVDGSPEPRVSWHFKGCSLKDGGRIKIYEEAGRRVLEIRDLDSSDAGLYTCRAQNQSGRVSASVQLEVTDELHTLQQERPPIFLRRLSNVEVVSQNQAARFDCRVSGVPRPEVTWLIENDPVSEDSRRWFERHEDGLCALVITDVTDEDDAFYTCVAKNAHGETRCSAELIVEIEEPVVVMPSSDTCVDEDKATNRGSSTKPPGFVSRPQSLTAEPPKPAHFSCIVRGNPEPEITWWKNGVLLVSGDRYNIHSEEGMSLLKIYATSKDDVGSYICGAKNGVGTVEASFDVCLQGAMSSHASIPGDGLSAGPECADIDSPEFQITVSALPESESAPPNSDTAHGDDADNGLAQLLSATSIRPGRYPPTFVKLPKCISCEDGAKFVCRVQGDPKPRVSWTKDSHRVDRDERLDYGEDEEEVYLAIRDVRTEDEGEYTCTLVNSEGTASASANLIVEAPNSPPSFIAKPRDCGVKDGEKVVFTCKVKGQPMPTIRWLFRDQPLRSDGEVYLISHDHGLSTLTLPDAILDDEGEYVAIASNPSGEARCSAKLSVRAPPPRPARSLSTIEAPSFTQSLRDVEAVDGTPLSLAVRVAGKPMPAMCWFFNGEPIKEDEDFKFVVDGERYSLVIAEVFPDDGGRYTCRITNDGGTAECTANVTVKEPVPEGTPPGFIQKPHSISTDEGCAVSLTCEVAGDLPISVTWNKDGQAIEPSKRFTTETSGPEGLKRALHIPAVLATDAGSYQCVIENAFGVEKCTASLVVKELEEDQTDFRALLKTRPRLQDLQNSPKSPSTKAEQFDFRHVLTRHVKSNCRPRFSKYLNDQQVEEGTRAVFECGVTGHPEPKILWYHQAKEIKESKFFRMTYIEDLARLEISEAFSEDEGEYACKATNTAGEIRCTAKLKVERTDSDNNCFSERRQSRISPPVVNGRGSISSTTSDDPPTRRVSSTLNIVLSPPVLKTETIPPVTIEIDAKSISNGISHSTGQIIDLSRRRSEVPAISRLEDVSRQSALEGKAPEFSSELQETHFVEGSDVRLRCKVLGDPKPELTWFRENARVREGRKYKVEVREEDVTLIVRDATGMDAGNYRLIVENSAGKAESSAELLMTAPPTILDAPGPVRVIIGESASIECKFNGTPAPSVKWRKLRRRVQTSDRYFITTTDTSTTLMIENVNEMDAGRYTLTVQNALGSDEANITLSVVGQPDPPVGKPVVTHVDSSSVDLSWTSSSYDGGSPVTSYLIETRQEPGNSGKWREVGRTEGTSWAVPGLESDAHYTFRVRAENEYGRSDAGRASEAVRTTKRANRTNGIPSSGLNPGFPSNITIKTSGNFSQHYELQEQVGKGRFGTVYSCLRKASGSKVAAKVIPVTPRKKAEVRNEVEIMCDLDHPRLMRCFDAFEEEKQVVMVLEYLSGGELFERVVDDDFSLTECDVIQYMRQICDGVRHMHERSILHLDLKPENIMCVDASGKNIKLIDFGLAKRFTGGEDVKVMSGTPEFVAPEVVNFDALGFTTDMWSVGVVAYILLSGLSPFMGDDDAETLNNVTRGDWDFEDEAFDVISKDAKEFISKLLVKNRKKRLSAKEAHNHRWLNQPTYSSRASRTTICTSKLKKFVTRRRWQKSANVVLAVNRMSLLTSKHTDDNEAGQLPKSQYDSCNGSVTSSNDKSRDTDNDSMASTQSSTSAYSSGVVSTNREADSLGETYVTTGEQAYSHRGEVDVNKNKCTSSAALVKPSFTKRIVDCTVFEGDCARFDCVIEGAPQPEVTWYLDDEEIEEDERFTMEYNERGLHSLIVRNAQEEDEGDYVVIAKNEAGQVSCAAEMLVEWTANGI